MNYSTGTFIKYHKLFFVLLLLSPILLTGQGFIQICENQETNGTVVDFEEYQGNIYATGFFDKVCGSVSSHLARWNGHSWRPTNVNLNGPGHSLNAIDDKLYISTYLQRVDSNWVYIFDGTDLEKLGAGVFNSAADFSNLAHVYDIVKYQDKIIVSGEFDRVGNKSVAGIIEWDGNVWNDLGGGFSIDDDAANPVLFPHQLLVHEDVLYAVGNFKYAGGVEVNGVAKWNGIEWKAMDVGFNGAVYSITVFEGEIYVGGDFTKSGEIGINRIAKWNGEKWEALHFGFDRFVPSDYVFVHTLVPIDNSLFISGGLKKLVFADGSVEFMGGIAEYKNGELETFNGGIINNDIEAIIKDRNNNIMIGGGVFNRGYFGLLDRMTNTVETTAMDARIQISPNPFHHQIQIKTNENIKELYVTDLTGKRQLLQLSNYPKVNLESLQKGFYFLEIHTDAGVFIEKIVKL